MSRKRSLASPTTPSTDWRPPSGLAISAKRTAWRPSFAPALCGSTATTSLIRRCRSAGTNSLDGDVKWVTRHWICIPKANRSAPSYSKHSPMFMNRVRIRVEFGDCDPAQIVFYANYFRWFDNCTSALFRAAGLPLRQLFKSHGVVGIPLVEARARFITPSTYGDVLVAESCVTEWRKSSFVISHRFLRDGALAMEGWETHVWAAAHP